MRRLRALVAVARNRSVNLAADALHLTPSAVTRAVRALEKEWGVALFERSRGGMLTTALGQRLVQRAERALAYLQGAEQQIRPPAARTPGALVQKASERQLQAVSAVADWQTETAAARQLGVSQPAVTQALRELEGLLGLSLFVRSPKAMVPTPEGEIVIRGAKLVLNELAAGVSDLAAQLGELRGRLTVGALPLSGAHLAPTALASIARAHPQLRLAVVEAPYDVLLKGLRCGDIDVVLGALHALPPADVLQERLFDDVLSVVARAGHPLAGRDRIALEDLRNCEWVLPFRRTSSRNTVEVAMLAAGVPVPEDAIEANSVGLVRGLLLEGDRLCVLSRRQIALDERQGILQVLPVQLQASGLPIGMTTRADALRTLGLEALLRELRALYGAPASFRS